MTSPFRARRHGLRLSVGQDGRIVEVDPYGNSRHDKPQHVVRKDRVYETDSYAASSTTSRHIPSARTGASCRWTCSGNKRYDKPQYQVKDGKVYETYAYRQRPEQKSIIKSGQATYEVSRGGDRRASH